MYYDITVNCWDNTASGINLKNKTNAYRLFHTLCDIALDSTENIKEIILWEVNPGVNVDILKSVSF